ncbi:ATP-grasp domain-containing protein [Longispora sp. K20-0274]|uniref:ATP-grasp domain-containing protein n=1 Tax=Longispora sp. K20-0274 TaxID=3088255 RepID=UPI00399986B6
MSGIVVVYDAGAAEPLEIRTGLTPLGRVVYALPPSEHNDRVRPLLAEFGEVVPLDGPGAVERVRRLRPDAVLTFSERRLRLASDLATELGLPGHDPDTARALTDKALQRARLRAAGVDRLRTAPLTGPADWPAAVAEVGLPAVLKPIRGEGSRDTHRILDAAAGAALVADLHRRGATDFVLEQYLVGRDTHPDGDYVSVESVVTRGRVRHVAVTGKYPQMEPFRERGQFWPARLDDGEADRIARLAGRALAALGVRTGVTHTEVKRTPDGPRVIEVNGRLGGLMNELSTRAGGPDLVRLAGRAALGEDPDVDWARPDGVFFQHYNPAPVRACRLIAVHGVAELRAIPGITGYRRLIQPGTDLPDSVMTRPLDLLTGRAADHAAMLELVGEARRALTFEFGTADGTVLVRSDRLDD